MEGNSDDRSLEAESWRQILEAAGGRFLEADFWSKSLGAVFLSHTHGGIILEAGFWRDNSGGRFLEADPRRLYS
jgi:hypothetical protein